MGSFGGFRKMEGREMLDLIKSKLENLYQKAHNRRLKRQKELAATLRELADLLEQEK